MVALAYNHSSQETETGGSYILMLPGLHGTTLKNNKSRETRQTKPQINLIHILPRAQLINTQKFVFSKYTDSSWH